MKNQRLYGPKLEYPDGYVSPITPEMIEHMKDCEAREWIKRRKQKMLTLGSKAASNWWLETVAALEKIRGESATLDLRQRIKRQMNENRT
jgi:hypothetical protein